MGRFAGGRSKERVSASSRFLLPWVLGGSWWVVVLVQVEGYLLEQVVTFAM